MVLEDIRCRCRARLCGGWSSQQTACVCPELPCLPQVVVCGVGKHHPRAAQGVGNPAVVLHPFCVGFGCQLPTCPGAKPLLHPWGRLPPPETAWGGGKRRWWGLQATESLGIRAPQHAKVLLLLLSEPREQPGQCWSGQEPPTGHWDCLQDTLIHLNKQTKSERSGSICQFLWFILWSRVRQNTVVSKKYCCRFFYVSLQQDFTLVAEAKLSVSASVWKIYCVWKQSFMQSIVN